MQLLRLPNGLQVWVTDPVEAEFLSAEIFEEQVYRPAQIHLDSRSVVLDVGANVGMASVFFAKTCGASTVYAFEPARAVFDALAMNFAMHNIAGGMQCRAMWSVPGRRWFTYYPHASANSGFYADAAADSALSRSFLRDEGLYDDDIEWIIGRKFVAESVEVPCDTVSSFLNRAGLPYVDLLKVDVERSELDVLAGVAEEHWRQGRIRQLLVEIHDNSDRVDRLLRGNGYNVNSIEAAPSTCRGGRILAATLP